MLEFCVLALLRDGERYSYELVRALGDADRQVRRRGRCTRWDGQAVLGAFTAEWKRFRSSVDTLLENGAV